MKEADLKRIIDSHDLTEFQQHVTSIEDLEGFFREFPSLSEGLILLVLHNLHEFQRLVQGEQSLNTILRLCSLKEELTRMLLDILLLPEEFLRLEFDRSLNFLTSVARQPQYHEKVSKILFDILADPQRLSRMVQRQKEFDMLHKLCQSGELVIKLGNAVNALLLPENFQRLEPNKALSWLSFAVKIFPEYHEKVAQILLYTPGEFQRLVPDFSALERSDIGTILGFGTFRTEPDPLLDSIIQYLLNNFREFQRLIVNTSDLHSLTHKCDSQELQKTIVQLVLYTPGEVERLLHGDYLIGIAEDFPEFHSRVAEILFGSNKFKHFIIDNELLMRTISLFPEHHAEITQIILSTPAIFRKLVPNNEKLQHLAEILPERGGLLRKPYVEVLNAIEASSGEIRKNARVLNQGKCGIFTVKGVTSHIASYTGEHGVHTKKEAEDICWSAIKPDTFGAGGGGPTSKL